MRMSVRWRLGLAALALAMSLFFLACEEEETAGKNREDTELRHGSFGVSRWERCGRIYAIRPGC